MISLIPVADGQMTRTKLFIPDYSYTSEFLDLASFDEVCIVNVASPTSDQFHLYADFVGRLLKTCFLPVTLGGGVQSVEDVERLMDLGADRVLIGSACIDTPRLLESVAERWGSQAVIAGLALRRFDGTVFAVRSREPSVPALPARDLARGLHEVGAGEILINSVDRDGSLSGIDSLIVEEIVPDVRLPYVVTGGVGNWKHLAQAIEALGASGVATSNIYHLTSDSVGAAKQHLAERGVRVRALSVEGT